METCCSSCGARLNPGSRFCSECGTAHVQRLEDESAATSSQFEGVSTDLAELLSARGHVVSCPRCDELNNVAAAYCRHCGQLLAAAGVSHPATPSSERATRMEETCDGPQDRKPPPARFSILSAIRHGPEIVMMALLGVTATVLWLGRSPEATQSAVLHSVLTAEPAESVVTTAPGEAVAPSDAPGAGAKEPETSPPISSPDATHKRTPALEHARKKVANVAVLRASAPSSIDELYHQRATQRCAEGLSGLICRQRLRFELCNGKWTQEARSGMEVCLVNRS